MPAPYLQCCRDNPYRPANWRWLRAAGVCEGSQPRAARKRDGADSFTWIRRAAHFQQQLYACQTASDEVALATRYPAIYWAYYAWNDDQQPVKWEIEARILGRATDDDIGFACGVSPDVVNAYANLFFHVREKLNHRGYVLHSVIGPAVQRGLSEREFDVLWKLYAYFQGPHMLDVLVSKFSNPGWCSSPDSVNAVIQDDAISTLKFKADLAAKMIPVNSSTQLELLSTFTKFVEVERTTDSLGKAQNQILDHVNAMLTSLPFNVAGMDPKQKNTRIFRGHIERYASSSVELSYEEAMQVAVGGQLSYADELTQLDGVNAAGESLAFPQRAAITQESTPCQ